MALQDVIGKMVAKIELISGIKGADEYLPEALPTADNWVVCYAGPSNFVGGNPAGSMTALYSVIIEIHTPRASLPSAVSKVMGFFDDIPNALFDELFDTKFTSTCSTIGNIESTGVISMEYAGIQTVGIRYTVQGVKLQTTVS